MHRRERLKAVGRLQSAVVTLALLIVAAGVAYLSTVQSGASSSSRSETSLSASASTSGSRVGNASWTTYHRDNARTGVDSGIESFGSVSAAWKSGPFDGAIYAEPLVVGDRVIVATENNSVYSVSARDGSVVWRAHLGEPVSRSELPCGNIDPSGITGTPVIDTTSGAVFVVAFLTPPHHELYALNLADGGAVFSRSADPAGADPLVEQQRGALTIAGGYVYIPYGGLFGDCGGYHGWVVGTRTDGTGDLLSFMVPTGRAGGVWAPAGAAADESGNLFVATGNSYSTDRFDFGNSVIKLSPALKVLDYFAPTNWSELNAADGDLGSVGPALLGSATVFQIGKEGVGYLLKAEKMGGIGGQEFSAKVCDATFGGTAYHPPLLFVPCVGGLTALSVKLDSSPSFQVVWRGPGFNAGPPIVAGGAVWTVDMGAGVLYAFRTGDGSLLFKSPLGRVAHFSTPASGNGRVYVAAENEIIAFRLNP